MPVLRRRRDKERLAREQGVRVCLGGEIGGATLSPARLTRFLSNKIQCIGVYRAAGDLIA